MRRYIHKKSDPRAGRVACAGSVIFSTALQNQGQHRSFRPGGVPPVCGQHVLSVALRDSVLSGEPPSPTPLQAEPWCDPLNHCCWGRLHSRTCEYLLLPATVPPWFRCWRAPCTSARRPPEPNSTTPTTQRAPRCIGSPWCLLWSNRYPRPSAPLLRSRDTRTQVINIRCILTKIYPLGKSVNLLFGWAVGKRKSTGPLPHEASPVQRGRACKVIHDLGGTQRASVWKYLGDLGTSHIMTRSARTQLDRRASYPSHCPGGQQNLAHPIFETTPFTAKHKNHQYPRLC